MHSIHIKPSCIIYITITNYIMQIRISIFPDKKTYIKMYQYIKGTFLLIF